MKFTRLLQLSGGLLLAVLLHPATALQYTLPTNGDRVVGHFRIIRSQPGDTWRQLARDNELGYREIEQANPKRSRYWEIKPNTPIVIPTMYILPDTSHDGIVINLPEMRLYYYLPDKNEVITEPVAVGRPGWKTPLFEATVIKKIENPEWEVPKSIQEYSLKKGIELPDIMPAGPENPLGKYAIRLSHWSVLMHGTIDPQYVGTRVSSGCIRLYPEDIKEIFEWITPNTTVRTIDQPFKVAWSRGQLYLEVHPPMAEDHLTQAHRRAEVDDLITAATKHRRVKVNWGKVDQMLENPSGMPLQISVATSHHAISYVIKAITPPNKSA